MNNEKEEEILDYMLMNDKEAAKVFEGDNAEIITNTENWQDVKKQNIN